VFTDTPFVFLAQTEHDNNQSLDDDWDEEKEGSLELAKKKQAELKAYYDGFPNIDDVTNEAGSDVQKAKQFTESILRGLPSGNLNERTTACHVLRKLLENHNLECLFFDSAQSKNLHDAFANLVDIDSEDRPFVLKLNSSKGLGGRIEPKTEHGAIRLVQTLSHAIEHEQSHPVIDDILDRLSKVHGIDKRYISIKTMYARTFSVVYTVRHLEKNVVQLLAGLSQKLKNIFEGYVTVKIHPLLYRPSFDIRYFSERGNKHYPRICNIKKVGPPENTMPYILPAEWTRYDLNVLNKYEDGNKWLDPFQDPENWYRAFHGTENTYQSFDQQSACVNAPPSIYCNEFRSARVTASGRSIYCSPYPKFAEDRHVHLVTIDTKKGQKTYKFMLQVAVNPSRVHFTNDKNIWIVPNPQDIRPYRVLIKDT